MIMHVEEIYNQEADLVPKELPVLIYPDPTLHIECEDITRFDDESNLHLTQLFGDLTLTMVRNNGIGISAPQVGILANMIVILAQQPDQNKPEPFGLMKLGARGRGIVKSEKSEINNLSPNP